MSSKQGLLGHLDPAGAEAFHILLVEDDELTLKVTEGLLRKCDYQVTLARNGREALRALQSPEGQHINLILTDVLMPEIDGIELMSELLQNEQWSHIPIIVMSSQASQESVLKAFEAGAKDYLIKPVRRNELATLWQHVWRVNRDLLPQHGSKLKMLPAGTKPYSSSDQSTEDTQLYNGEPVSSLQLLCEVASNEQASTSQALSPQATSALDRSRSCVIKHASTELQPALDPVELHIRPLDVAPAHPSAQRAVSGMLPAQLGPSSGSLYNMPAALRELAALGNRLEQERNKQRSSDEEEQANGSDAANALRHSESTSPFQTFTAFVPRPCSRGDTEVQPAVPTLANLQQLSLTASDPVRAADLATRLTGHPQVTPDQQQQFFQAFQAAVEQHQLAVEACAVNRKAAIAKFREKRKARNFNKKVRYESRRRLAETRPRVRGQFVKAGTAAAQSIASQAAAAQITEQDTVSTPMQTQSTVV